MRRTLLAIVILLYTSFFLLKTIFATDAVPSPVLEAMHSVLRITAEYTDGTSSGSGFIISSDRENTYIATNWHVVEDDPYKISVWQNVDESIAAKILSSNPQKDLCILKLSSPVSLPALQLNEKEVKQGDAVYAIGFPGASDALSDTEAYSSTEATITSGIVSALREMTIVPYGSPTKLLQISAAINEGNSGGPLFNSDGYVIGINTYGVYDSQGVFGAIAVQELIDMMSANRIALQKPVTQFQWSVGLGIILSVFAVGLLFIVARRKRRYVLTSSRATASGTLQEAIDDHAGPYSMQEAVSLLMSVAQELKSLHDSGSAYSGVSPMSIGIKKGKATLLSQEKAEANRLANGFAPPEMYAGKGQGSASDIYSFCAVLHYMVTGKQPENALSRSGFGAGPAGVENIEEIEDIADASILDEVFSEILQKGMALDAVERYQTMHELIYALIPYNQSSKLSVTQDNKAIAAQNKKAPKKKGKLVVIIALSLVLLSVGAYFICYAFAVSYAESGEFKKAHGLTIPSIAVLHVPRFMSYLEAGMWFEDKEYQSALHAFQTFGEYRNAPEMALESEYRYAAQLAEKNDFTQSLELYTRLSEVNYKDSADLILDTSFREAAYDLFELGEHRTAYNKFKKLSDSGYEKADEMSNEAQYLWAISLVEQEDYIWAYEQFKQINDYKDTDELLTIVTDILYLEGQEAYYEGKYALARERFLFLGGYKQSRDYTTLIEVKDPSSLFNMTSEGIDYYEDILRLVELGFEDAADVLISNVNMAIKFLPGKWETANGEYYFEIDPNNRKASYSLPVLSTRGTWTYRIEEGKYILRRDGYRDVTQFAFLLLGTDSMQVYCYKNGETYTLYRQ